MSNPKLSTKVGQLHVFGTPFEVPVGRYDNAFIEVEVI
jgi:hypothetical protein